MSKAKPKKKKAPPKLFAKPGGAASGKRPPVKRGQPLRMPGLLGSMVPR